MKLKNWRIVICWIVGHAWTFPVWKRVWLEPIELKDYYCYRCGKRRG